MIYFKSSQAVGVDGSEAEPHLLQGVWHGLWPEPFTSEGQKLVHLCSKEVVALQDPGVKWGL